MVRPLNAVQRARARANAEATMADVCNVITTTAAAPDSFGYVGRTTDSPVAYPCGVQFLSTEDQYSVPGGGDRDSVVIVASLRLPLWAYGTVQATTKVAITAMRGETLTDPVVCEVVGEPLRGTAALLCDLRRITL